MSKQVTVKTLPPCDFCGKPAHVDGKTSFGPWGYMCKPCWTSKGCGQLGTGYGQKLVLDKT